jgi:hypothetical protein
MPFQNSRIAVGDDNVIYLNFHIVFRMNISPPSESRKLSPGFLGLPLFMLQLSCVLMSTHVENPIRQCCFAFMYIFKTLIIMVNYTFTSLCPIFIMIFHS